MRTFSDNLENRFVADVLVLRDPHDWHNIIRRLGVCEFRAVVLAIRKKSEDQLEK